MHEHIQYFPFGETWVQQGGNTEKSPYLFTSKELDEETGLYYFGARYYDPRTSVWQSVDPILGSYLNGQKGMGGVFNPMNLAMFTYVHLNPLALIDPDGNSPYQQGYNANDVRGGFIFNSNTGAWESRVYHQDNYDPSTSSALLSLTVGTGAAAILAPEVIAACAGSQACTASAIAFGTLDRLNSAADGVPSGGAPTNASRVFWSGGNEAKSAAEAFAKANGGVTLEMTSAGKNLEKLTTGMDWAEAKPLWEAASREFAEGAQGAVNVFHNGSRGVSLESVWRNIEHPVLKQKGNDIIYNVTTQSGVVKVR